MKHNVKQKNRLIIQLLLPLSWGLWSCNNKKSENVRGIGAQVAPSGQDQGADGSGESAGDRLGEEKKAAQDAAADSQEVQSEGSVNPMNPADPVNMPAPPAPKVYSLVGIRNFESINSTFSVLTGVPKTTPTIVTAFEANKISLPTNSYAEDLTSSAVVGLYKLSATYCDELSKSTTLRPAVYGTFDFAGLPAAVLADAGMKTLAESMVSRFWGKDLAKLAPHDTNVTQLVMTITELKAEFPGNTAADTVKIVNAACTAALMSTPSLVY